MSVISGTAYWASIQSPNTKFEPHRWSINVGNLDAENKAIAEKDGLTVKNKGDEKGDFVTIERKTTKKEKTLMSSLMVIHLVKQVVKKFLLPLNKE